jgi:hypothetical protein
MLNVCGPKLRKLPETFVDPVKLTAVDVNVGALVVEYPGYVLVGAR